jgi:hypothetical protein
MTADAIQRRVRDLVRNDDPAALELLYDAFASSLLAFLLSRLRSRAAAVAAVWAVCIGFTLREDHLTTHAFAASRPAAPARGDYGVAAILKESGLSGAYARLWTTAPHIPSRTDSWAALRQAMAL